MLDHAASVIAPAGADLRVVARVRMLTPGRRVANLRVAMRVTVTERDEDLRSLVRAVKQAVRTLALVALLVAALAAGTATGPGHRGPAALAAPTSAVSAVSAIDGTGAPGSVDADGCQATAPVHGSLAAACVADGVVPAAPAPASAPEDGPWVPAGAEPRRLPRLALAAGVLPSPD